MQSAAVNERAVMIKDDEEAVNRFVEEYRPFIAACVERITGRYVKYGEDDELSIALVAFVEAIRSYDINRGNFLSFAQNVIKRRVIDYFRKEKKHSNVISLSGYCGGDEDGEPDLSIGKSLDIFSTEEISEYRRLEIEELKQELLQWDISLLQLVEVSPKHAKTRKTYADIAKFILSRPELVRQIRSKKYLPVAELEKGLNIPRKIIERGRKYIIAVVIIATGDYQYIADYIDTKKYYI